MFAIYNIIKIYHDNLHAEEFYCCACCTSQNELVQYSVIMSSQIFSPTKSDFGITLANQC